MKKLHFDYHMTLNYSIPVQSCHFTLRCLPVDTPCQQIRELQLEICPSCSYERGTDSFGNQTVYGQIPVPHEQFAFHVSGLAITGLGDACPAAESPQAAALPADVVPQSGAVLQTSPPDEEARLPLYRYPHGLTRAGDGLLAYYDTLLPLLGPLPDPLEKGIFLMHRLHEDFRYEKLVTGVHTGAEAAWQLGRGVCQDYAHILIVLCRLAGIPARYVTGMLCGEGSSHAWTEISTERGWIGLDPTNDQLVTDQHIRIGCGRDAADCMINRGILKGGGTQTQTVRVLVSPAEKEQ